MNFQEKKDKSWSFVLFSFVMAITKKQFAQNNAKEGKETPVQTVSEISPSQTRQNRKGWRGGTKNVLSVSFKSQPKEKKQVLWYFF
jgi:hypothetical protein